MSLSLSLTLSRSLALALALALAPSVFLIANKAPPLYTSSSSSNPHRSSPSFFTCVARAISKQRGANVVLGFRVQGQHHLFCNQPTHALPPPLAKFGSRSNFPQREFRIKPIRKKTNLHVNASRRICSPPAIKTRTTRACELLALRAAQQQAPGAPHMIQKELSEEIIRGRLHLLRVYPGPHPHRMISCFHLRRLRETPLFRVARVP